MDMKKWTTLFTLVAVTVLSLTAVNANAGTKKNDPNKKEVEQILKEIGGDHYVEKMKINSLCSMKLEDAAGEDLYYHIFNISLKKGGYRVAIFDNTPNYLGFYATEYEAADYEEGAILLDSGDSDEDGNTSYFNLPLKASGPVNKTRIDGVPTAFVKNPKLEGGAKAAATTGGSGAIAVPKAKSSSGATIDYRDWKITIQGKERTYNAIFVQKTGSKIQIKDSKRGKTATIPISALSKADQTYLKELGEL
jgi:hypothetical protein